MTNKCGVTVLLLPLHVAYLPICVGFHRLVDLLGRQTWLRAIEHFLVRTYVRRIADLPI